MMKPGPHRKWDARRARWYSEALPYSDYGDRIRNVMEPVVRGCGSLLDVGAGCGALSIPLAHIFGQLVALDPSEAMIAELRERAEHAGLENIETEHASWEQACERIGKYDVVLCANVAELLTDLSKNVSLLEAHAARFVFLVLGTPRNANKFYFQELWPLIFGEDLPRKQYYFEAYRALCEAGIFANVSIAKYHFDQPFKSIDEAVLFWKSYLGVEDDAWDAKLQRFLSERLNRFGGLFWASVPKESAVIWWEIDRRNVGAACMG